MQNKCVFIFNSEVPPVSKEEMTQDEHLAHLMERWAGIPRLCPRRHCPDDIGVRDSRL